MAAPVTAEDLYRFRFVDHARISPDGSRIAYQVWWADEADRANRGRIHLLSLTGVGEPVELTHGPHDISPEWAPDGDRIAFVRREEGTSSLMVVDAAGGDPRVLAATSDGIGRITWSPDGSRIAFLGGVLADLEAVVDDPRPALEGRGRRAPVARVWRRVDQWADGRGHLDGRLDHVFVVDATGGEVRQVTRGAFGVADFDWSPEGRRLAVVCNPDPGSDLLRENQVHLVELETGNLTPLVTGLLVQAVAWSPDGDRIAFAAPAEEGGGLFDRVWMVHAGGGEPRCLTLEFDRSAGDGLITDTRPGHGLRILWSGHGSRIYFLASGPGWTGVHSVAMDAVVREEVTGRRRIYDFDVRSGSAVYCSADLTGPGEVFVHTGDGERRLTDLNPWLAERYVAEPEHLDLRAPDGLAIDGWLIKPDGFDPSRRHPLVLEVHGGPHGQYGWAFFHEFQVLAGAGMCVLYMNPRGSDGYGQDFRRAVVRDWGGKDYQDLMAGLDQVIARGFVDESRLGIGGGSYGGFMTNWAIGQTDRFSAAVAMRSLSNLVSDYAAHDIVPWAVLEMGPPPWPDADELWDRSPIKYVQNIHTPLLLTHGEMDLRCPIHQAEEMFGALRLLGREVELVRFPEESHDLSRGGRPDRRVERLNRITGWFLKHLRVETAGPVGAGAPE